MFLEEKRREFYVLWTACVCERKYNKRRWMDLELELEIARKQMDPKFVEEVLAQARNLQIEQIDLN